MMYCDHGAFGTHVYARASPFFINTIKTQTTNAAFYWYLKITYIGLFTSSLVTYVRCVGGLVLEMGSKPRLTIRPSSTRMFLIYNPQVALVMEKKYAFS